MSSKIRLQTDTLLAHGGLHPEDHFGFVNPPIYRGSTVVIPTLEALHSGSQRYQYGRWDNPTAAALKEVLTELEGAAGTVLCPSGLAACTTAILAVAGSGDHILVSDSVYGPTRHFCETMGRRMGIETTYYDPRIGSGIASLMRPNTRAVYVESPGSYTMELQDIPAIASAAHSHGALVIADNTWATPLLCRTLDLGADVVVMAATKYIVGHSDALLGTISATPSAWDKVKAAHFELGLSTGPDDVTLALRGLRTLGVRLKQHQENALTIAQWLSERPEVGTVLYPALTSHPDHTLWRRDFAGASGLLSFTLKKGGVQALADFVNHLELVRIGYSWGGFESLVMPFDATQAALRSTEAPPQQIVRLHVGLENSDDLIVDLERGLSAMQGNWLPKEGV